jgi:hypothetical protein
MLFPAYQVKTPFEIDLGEPGDGAYLRNFYDIETADAVSYRWSSDRSSIFLPGIGGYTPVLLRVRLNSSRPEGLPLPQVSLRANGLELPPFTASEQFEIYESAIDKQTVGTSGNLEVEIDSGFIGPAQVMRRDDLRKLWILADFVSVGLELTMLSIVVPSPCQLLYLVSAVMASCLSARQLGLPAETALTMLLSRRVYGALLLYSIFVYVTPRLPSRESEEAICLGSLEIV